MTILVPVDGSKCSMRALAYAIDLAQATDDDLHVVHFTDHETEETTEVETLVQERLDEADLAGEMEVVGDIRLADFKASNRVGKDILELVGRRDYDQIVMGHHGSGFVESALLGSAAETVVAGTDVPVTIVP
jgi:nucleotide-binding universal stress UspA family protein